MCFSGPCRGGWHPPATDRPVLHRAGRDDPARLPPIFCACGGLSLCEQPLRQKSLIFDTSPCTGEALRSKQTKKQATRLGDLAKGLPREPSAAGRVGKGTTAERVRNGACAIAKDAKLVVTPRLELASRHPTNGVPPFAGTLPHLRFMIRAP